jgi:ferredoxin
VDGTYPSGTTAFEKRNISDLVAEWDPDLCIQCGNCSFVCPHSVIRAKFYDQAELAGAPTSFPSAPLDARGLPDTRYSLQVSVKDYTGCSLCVEACPVQSPTEPGKRAINLVPREPLVDQARESIAFFEGLPAHDRARVDFGTLRGTQFLQPLFELSGACAGCGETPYLKLLSQLFGDRLTIANATGCSSIYGGNLPTTPCAVDAASTASKMFSFIGSSIAALSAPAVAGIFSFRLVSAIWQGYQSQQRRTFGLLLAGVRSARCSGRDYGAGVPAEQRLSVGELPDRGHDPHAGAPIDSHTPIASPCMRSPRLITSVRCLAAVAQGLTSRARTVCGHGRAYLGTRRCRTSR